MTTRLLLATRNRGKVAEFRRLFDAIAGLEVISLNDVEGVPEVAEDGASFEDNARKKALQTAQAASLMTLADDSGLEVDALGGTPGVRSARFDGERAADADNNRKLLGLLANVPDPERTARFRCVLALAFPVRPGAFEVHVEHGVCEGRILWEPRGDQGFGYDPLFLADGESLTMAELDADRKNRISHRGRAALKMREYLRRRLEP